MSSEEEARREARRQRFNIMKYAVEGGGAREISEGMSEEDWCHHQEELSRRASRAAKFGVDTSNALKAASSKVLAERCDQDSNLEPRNDSLHMYSLDSDFVSVRTRDILSYFSGYGPSYVEW